MAKKKAKGWWATRNNYPSGRCDLHNRISKPIMDGIFYPRGRFYFTAKDFHALNPLRLKPGQCVKINKPRLVL